MTKSRQIDYPEEVALSAVDWNFPDRVVHSDIEALHSYPAKFITEIPGAFMDALPVPAGAAVLDPFCGSGPTLVESQRRGIPCIGIDLNPIAVLITRVKTSPIPSGIDQAIGQTIDRAHQISSVPIPAIPNLDHWFKKPVQDALASFTAAIASAQPEYSDILRLALSSIIVRVSNQDSDTRYATVSKDVSREDVFSGFAAAAHRISAVLSARGYELAPATVINADTLTLPPCEIECPVGLVITSPPYPNAYEYWLYHKYRMWWLGFDPLAVKEREIGARAHFFKRNHHTADNFASQMSKTFDLLRSVVIPGGYACFLVGRSKIHGEVADNAAIIESVADATGFSPVFRCERSISPRRKSFNLSYANINTETLLVLRRTDGGL
jgi:site-specific DNA-methyltransferase (cytosine-N4-specific)